jgi:SSS family solute:Na+ symporter
MIAVALWKQGAPGFEAIETNPQGAFPILVSNLLPVGLKGLVLAGMLSALMSSLASLFNSTATCSRSISTSACGHESSEKHLVTGGPPRHGGRHRARHGVDSVLQDLGKGQLYTYLQLVQSLLAPSIAAVFMAGIFFDTVTPTSGLIGISTGFALGWPGSSCRRRTRCTPSSGRASSRTSSISTGCTSASCCSCSPAC